GRGARRPVRARARGPASARRGRESPRKARLSRMEAAIREALSRVIDPELRKPVTELDMVRAIEVDGGRVRVTIALTIAGCPLRVLAPTHHGQSMPHIVGIHQRPVVVDKMIIPPVKDDLKLMSIGFFLDDNAPVMSRGPMLHRALEQFLSDVHWGALDVLVVDMPPGTGDVAISLGQLLPRAETLVVTTPQPAAQEVAARAGAMAQKTGMRLTGVVENM